MKNNIDVSIIVPVYNSASYLIRCFNSIKKAVGNLSYEVILVDDGSTDNSEEIINNYIKNNNCFSYHKIDHLGAGGARNTGIELARGNYIQFIDSDDFISPNLIEDMHKIAILNDSDFVMCNVARIEDGIVSPSILHINVFSKTPLDKKVTNLKDNPYLVWDFIVCDKLIKREFLNKNNIRYECNVAYEDMLPAFLINYYAKKVSLLRTRGYYWKVRSKDNSTSQTVQYSYLTDKINAINNVLSFIDENKVSKDVRRIVERKTVTNDFVLFLNNLEEFGDKKEEVVSIIGDFYRQNLSQDTMDTLPIINKQITIDILNNNIDHLQQMIEYKNTDNKTVGITHIDKDYFFDYPDGLLEDDERNVKNDFFYSVPMSTINNIKYSGFYLDVSGYMYSNRINQESFDDLLLRAYLLNSISGKYIELDLERVMSERLTKEKGLVDNKQYNYDYAGYCVKIDFEELNLNDDFLGKNYIVLYYENSIYKGYRVLRGLSNDLKLKIAYYNCFLDDYSINLEYELDNSFSIYIQKYSDNCSIKEQINKLLKENQSLHEEINLLNKTNRSATDYIKELTDKNESLTSTVNSLAVSNNKVQKELKRTINSMNYKIGYYITWLPKKIIYIFKKKK